MAAQASLVAACSVFAVKAVQVVVRAYWASQHPAGLLGARLVWPKQSHLLLRGKRRPLLLRFLGTLAQIPSVARRSYLEHSQYRFS